ncbi:MAG TPA: hypothetical protein VNF47_01225 [Streptosporangiaceae bacterium]|nr:hypothetical protein [Streptosporangiaceae bacterium]
MRFPQRAGVRGVPCAEAAVEPLIGLRVDGQVAAFGPGSGVAGDLD